VLMIHLPIGRGLPKRKGERRKQFCSQHDFAACVGYLDHLNATFIPATKARGDPA